MFKSLMVIFILMVLFAASVQAQDPMGLSVEEIVVCSAVEDRQPVGADTVFSTDVERVYCYTKITGSLDTTAVIHAWYLGDEEKARVNLAIKGKTWRTWSSKRIVPEWTGRWRVDVLSPSGEVIRSVTFSVK